MADPIEIPEIDDSELREHILKLRGLVGEETIETLKMVRMDHVVNPRGKITGEYDQQTFRAWVIAWLNALETVLCAQMALLTKRLSEGISGTQIRELAAQPERMLEQVEDIRRALEIILSSGPEMTPEPVGSPEAGEIRAGEDASE